MDLYLLNRPENDVDAFKTSISLILWGEEHQTFKLKITQFKEFLASKGVNATDLLNQGWQQYFEDFTHCEPSAYRRELLENLDTLEAVIHRVVNTYGVLRMKENEVNALKENGSRLHDEILHAHQIKSSVKMQSQDIQINPVQAMDDSLIVSKSSLIEPENNNAFSKSEIETQMQRQEEKVDMREAVDAGLVVTESSRTKSDKQDTSSSSRNYTTQAVDADIRPVNDDEPFTEVNSRAKVQSSKIRNNNPIEPKNHTHKPGRQNGIGQRFSLNKSSADHEKPHTHRSCLRWKPTGRIFKTVSLRWIPTGKVFIDSTTDSEPPNGSNDDITNPYECNQTLYISAGTSNSSVGTSVNPSKERLGRSLLHDNIVPKPDLALELGKSISLTEAEEVVAREVHATHARIMSESEPEPTQRRQSGIAFRDSFIVSKKRSSDSSKKLKGIQTLTPVEQEAADIMKALKESKKMSKRQPGTGGSNEGTGNILGVPDESTVVSRASSEGTGSKPGVPDEEKLISLVGIRCAKTF
ncbi:hypothetical protein Tco_1272920 [Tanacetum coccineum]